MKIFKNKKKRRILLSLICLFIAFYIVATDSRMKIVKYEYKSKKIDKPFKIAQVADLHSCYYGENQQDLIEALEREKPDIVVLVGDIFEEDMPDDNARIFIEGIKDKFDTYYITGNHEFRKDKKDLDAVLELIRANNITILRGDRKAININGNEVYISGVDDENIDWFEGKGSFDKQAAYLMESNDPSKFNIFLAHRPYLIEAYAKAKFDLVLCGHSHGGQVRIPYILNGLIEPDQGFFPKYAGGRYEVEDSTLILSRGLARESSRVPRVFNRPELVFIEVVGE